MKRKDYQKPTIRVRRITEGLMAASTTELEMNTTKTFESSADGGWAKKGSIWQEDEE